jgi:hypothetical protein
MDTRQESQFECGKLPCCKEGFPNKSNQINNENIYIDKPDTICPKRTTGFIDRNALQKLTGTIRPVQIKIFVSSIDTSRKDFILASRISFSS